MFMHHSEPKPGPLDEEFSRPVESIMKCEDFKSNFARRLSNRYIARLPASTTRQSSLKIRNNEEVNEHAPDRIEQIVQLTKAKIVDQNGEAVRPPDKIAKNRNIRDTEVSALNLEIETLRWQLGQTEANRQMHIALLKQIVLFLSRVKEHIECQSPVAGPSQETESMREISSTSFSIADLPRSRSVFHVNRNAEYSLGNGKKLTARKISKSISNVNGFKDCNGVWNQSKIALTPDMESAHKVSEEIARLITLANTVLSTKLPDLACKCNNSTDTIKETICDETLDINETHASLIDQDTTNSFILNTIYDSEDAFDGLTTKLLDTKERTLTNFIVSSSPLSCGLGNEFGEVNLNEKDESIHSRIECNKARPPNKRDEYSHVTNFIEDESGFSSMSSFQEIGIPIISIIPPSPCKEVGYIDELTEILDEAEKWKNDSIDLDKQTVKVFWV